MDDIAYRIAVALEREDWDWIEKDIHGDARVILTLDIEKMASIIRSTIREQLGLYSISK